MNIIVSIHTDCLLRERVFCMKALGSLGLSIKPPRDLRDKISFDLMLVPGSH